MLAVLVVYPSSSPPPPSLGRIEHRFLMMNMPGKVGRRGDVSARKGVCSPHEVHGPSKVPRGGCQNDSALETPVAISHEEPC